MPLAKPSQLNIVLSLKDKASAKLKTFDKDFKSMAKGMAKMAAVAGAAVAVGIGTKAIKSAADFERAMGNVATLVDTSRESMVRMGKEVRDIAKRVPKDIGELTAALYQVRSAGISAGKAMKVLESSAKLATAGLGTTEEATDLLTSAFNVFAQQGYDADEIANILFKTVKAGKTTVSELAMSFGMVAPIAGEMNVKLTELQAATAALTITGQKASVAQTQLRAGIVALLRPTKDMSDLYEHIGVHSGRELIETSGGLIAAFGKIRDAAEKTAGPEGGDSALAKALGSVEALNMVLALTSGEIGEAFIDTLKDMENKTDDLTTAFNKQKETAHAQWQILKNELNDVFIELGTKILPAVIEMIQKIAPALQETLEWVVRNMDKIISPFRELRNFLEGIVGYIDLISKYGLIAAARPEYYQTMEWEMKRREEELERSLIERYRLTRGEEISPGVWRYPTVEEIREEWRRMSDKEKKRLFPDIWPGAQMGGTVIAPLGSPVPIIAHGGETIIPAGKRMGITINITGNTFMSDEEAAEKIGDMIIERLKMQTRL